VTVYGDSGYSSMELSAHLQEVGHHECIKPRPLAEAVPGGYRVDDVAVKDPTEETPHLPGKSHGHDLGQGESLLCQVLSHLSLAGSLIAAPSEGG